jgi:TDG/mug DNA glycosylase family protein
VYEGWYSVSRMKVTKARCKKLKDVIAPDLTVLFCGINPGLYSAAAGHNFARPGNRFWPALYGAGFTPRLFVPSEERDLLSLGYGITNFVSRATVSADELTKEELIRGGTMLVRKIHRYRPKYLAVVGLTAYRIAFAAPKAKLGLQDRTIGGTRLWILPNTSGLNAHHQLPDLIGLFRKLHACATKS